DQRTDDFRASLLQLAAGDHQPAERGADVPGADGRVYGEAPQAHAAHRAADGVHGDGAVRHAGRHHLQLLRDHHRRVPHRGRVHLLRDRDGHAAGAAAAREGDGGGGAGRARAGERGGDAAGHPHDHGPRRHHHGNGADDAGAHERARGDRAHLGGAGAGDLVGRALRGAAAGEVLWHHRPQRDDPHHGPPRHRHRGAVHHRRRAPHPHGHPARRAAAL
ncbi:MAG: hypothetical protein AVDCRST_MAG68-3020, partial [uncultured Gemmatimonadetes bacterium]